jgi:hypothetical protein
VRVGAFIWNGSSLLHLVASQQVSGLDPSVQVAAAALVLNVALILFGWRRYADLQQEAALRAEGERAPRSRPRPTASPASPTARALPKASTRSAGRDRRRPLPGHHLAPDAALQADQRPLRLRHGRRPAARIGEAMRATCPPARWSRACRATSSPSPLRCHSTDLASAERLAEALLRDVSRTYDIDGTYVQVGAIAGIASAAPAPACRAADILRRADIALDHARSARAARPTWFDSGMERR